MYESLQAFFDRDDVALPGLTAYFRDQAEGERRHARNLMAFLNQRGGRVALASIPQPHQDFSSDSKGDALNAMELALARACSLRGRMTRSYIASALTCGEA